MKSHAQNSTMFKPGDILESQTYEFLSAFAQAGGTSQMMQTAIERPAVMRTVVKFMEDFGQIGVVVFKPTLGCQDVTTGQVHEFMIAFGKGGGTAQMIVGTTQRPLVMQMIVRSMQSSCSPVVCGGDFVAPIEVDIQAGKIFKITDFFGVMDAAECFGLHPHDPIFKHFEKLPENWGLDPENFMLIADLGHSIEELYELYPDCFGDTHFWLNDGKPTSTRETKEFAKIRGIPGWKLVRRTGIPDTFDLPWSDQLDQKRGGEVPPARLVAYTSVVMYQSRGLEMFKDCLLRSIDPLPREEQNSVVIGHWPILIDRIPDSSNRRDIGLAGAGPINQFREEGEPHPVTPALAAECARESTRFIGNKPCGRKHCDDKP